MNHLTFIEYLSEVMVDVDPNDPTTALKKTKMAIQNPDRFRKEQIATSVDDQKEIQQQQDDPLKSEKLRISKMKQQVVANEKRLAQKQNNMNKRAGIEGQA